ncbi:cysteine protease family C01A, partial [Achlya hypogyna]
MIKTLALTTTLLASASSLKLSATERSELLDELAQWKKSQAGQTALVQGLLPPHPKTEGLDAHAKLEVELERFAHTKQVVAQLNAEHDGAAVFSTDNQFALMTDAEFKAYVQGAFGRPLKKRQLRGEHIQRELTPAQREASGKDWTSSKCMPAVKNQGSCGSCWSFAAVGASAMAHCIATGQLLDLSEQQLVSCASSAGQGCQGGWPNRALEYIAQTGVCTAADFPYTQSNSQCKQSCRKNKLSIGRPVDIRGESALQSALDKQPVTVVVEAGNNVWRNYKSGIVKSCPGAQSDHAVIAVGYGNGFFKIRNSWGTNWGEQGYMRLQKGSGGNGMCNVAEAPSYPTISGSPQPDDNDDNGGDDDLPTWKPDDDDNGGDDDNDGDDGLPTWKPDDDDNGGDDDNDGDDGLPTWKPETMTMAATMTMM